MLLKFSSAVLSATLLLCVVYQSKGESDLESIIEEVFKPTSKPNSSCTCVPYYLCNSTITNSTSEEGITNNNRENGTSTSCENILDVCCNDIDRVTQLTTSTTPTTENDRAVNDLVEAVFRTNDSGSSHNSSCTCVPYYLCSSNDVGLVDGEGIIDIRENRNATCESYLEVCCKTNETVNVPVTPPPRSQRVGCGYRNPEGVGFKINDIDFEAQFGEFPWMTAILREESFNGANLNVYQCGGALIHPQVVMTAAHCVHTDLIGRLKIRVGEWDTQTKNEIFPHQDRSVSSFTIHPEYYRGRLYNDIALLFLQAPVTIGENVNVICLPSQNEVIENSKCYASGWGRNIFGKKGKYQVILKKVDLPMMSRTSCQENLRNKTKLGRFFELHQSFVCAGGESGKDTCKGDGGSPLVCPIRGHEDEERYAQVGIVAWGSGCGEANVPGVYVNVALFRNWIDEQMKLKNLDLSSYQFMES